MTTEAEAEADIEAGSKHRVDSKRNDYVIVRGCLVARLADRDR